LGILTIISQNLVKQYYFTKFDLFKRKHLLTFFVRKLDFRCFAFRSALNRSQTANASESLDREQLFGVFSTNRLLRRHSPLEWIAAYLVRQKSGISDEESVYGFPFLVRRKKDIILSNTGVNFINILRTNFSYVRHFGSFF